jgi:hypothetical protein
MLETFAGGLSREAEIRQRGGEGVVAVRVGTDIITVSASSVGRVGE